MGGDDSRKTQTEMTFTRLGKARQWAGKDDWTIVEAEITTDVVISGCGGDRGGGGGGCG